MPKFDIIYDRTQKTAHIINLLLFGILLCSVIYLVHNADTLFDTVEIQTIDTTVEYVGYET